MRKKRTIHSIESLRLNIQAALDGRTWLLLPEGFQSRECGTEYPLPTLVKDLKQLVAIPIPHNKRDCGSIYLRRAVRKWKNHGSHKSEKLKQLGMEYESQKIQDQANNFRRKMKEYREDAKRSVDLVHDEAEKASASLKDLFTLMRRGLHGMMDAFVHDKEFNGSKITQATFIKCGALTSSTVKAIGMPSDQKRSAQDAIFEELAEGLRSTQEAVDLAVDKDQTEH